MKPAPTGAASSLYCYAWDLAGESGARNRDWIAEFGIGGISLATSYHAGKFLRPHATDSKVVFPEDGTVYFRPQGKYGRVQPLVAQVSQQQDVLADIIADGRFAVQGWTVLLHNTRLGYLHPDLVARTAWGDPLYYSLCPSQPEVRRYAVTMCADLCAHYQVTGLALETPGFLPFVHGYHHEFGQITTSSGRSRSIPGWPRCWVSASARRASPVRARPASMSRVCGAGSRRRCTAT
jgi:hypothetical protein